jgi:ABC-type dipeptide/oligopeptide/nickel transport system permease subunit
MAVAGKPGAAHAAIVAGMLSISLVGDRLRDRLEPTLR